MKAAGLKHKEQLCAEEPEAIHPYIQDKYRIPYVTDPDKIYVMRPEGELNYDLYAKNPKKFYNHVFNQEVEKIKVKETHQRATNKDGSPRRR